MSRNLLLLQADNTGGKTQAYNTDFESPQFQAVSMSPLQRTN